MPLFARPFDLNLSLPVLTNNEKRGGTAPTFSGGLQAPFPSLTPPRAAVLRQASR
jgi:hypothetical protein